MIDQWLEARDACREAQVVRDRQHVAVFSNDCGDPTCEPCLRAQSAERAEIEQIAASLPASERAEFLAEYLRPWDAARMGGRYSFAPQTPKGSTE